MARFVLTVVVAFSVLTGYAADPKIEEKCQAVLEQNFQAVVGEDWKALQKSMSVQTGTPAQIAEFKDECDKMWHETDVYMRLVDFKILRVQLPMAEGLVLQMTLPASEKDREPVLHQRLGVNFRHYSALLPEYEMVVYKQLFRYEGGKWKVHQVSSVPVAADSNSFQQAGKQQPAAQRNNCPNGNCQFPRVKVSMR
jgi:hypothetical protein